MFKKYLTLIIAIFVINLSFGASAYAGTSSETKETKAAKLAAKVKVGIAKLGPGTDSKVKVKLKDGTKLQGYVSQINETSFVVMNDRTGTPTEVLYPNAKQVKGNNLSTGAKIAIGIGIGIGIVVLFAFIATQTAQ